MFIQIEVAEEFIQMFCIRRVLIQSYVATRIQIWRLILDSSGKNDIVECSSNIIKRECIGIAKLFSVNKMNIHNADGNKRQICHKYNRP